MFLVMNKKWVKWQLEEKLIKKKKKEEEERGRSCVRTISTILDKGKLGFVGSIDIWFMIKKK